MNASSGFYYSGDGTIKNLATGETTYTHEQALKLANGREVFSGFVYNGQGEIINIDSLKNSSGGDGVTKEYVDDCDTEIKEELKKKVDSSTLENYVQKESGKALFSGSYSDLKDKPTKLSQFTNDSGYAVSGSLATVSKTGSYNDLKDKPTTISNADTVDEKHASEFILKNRIIINSLDDINESGIYFANWQNNFMPTTAAWTLFAMQEGWGINVIAVSCYNEMYTCIRSGDNSTGEVIYTWSNWVKVGGEFNTKTLKNPTATTHSDWSGNDVTGNIIPTMNMFAYWNGAYNSDNKSNLAYCNKGEFHSMATKSSSNYLQYKGVVSDLAKVHETCFCTYNGDTLNTPFKAGLIQAGAGFCIINHEAGNSYETITIYPCGDNRVFTNTCSNEVMGSWKISDEASKVNGVTFHPGDTSATNNNSQPWVYAFNGGDDYNCYVKNMANMKAGDSDKLNGQSASYYATATHNHSTLNGKYPLLADTTAINTFANYYTAGSNRLIVDINGTKLKIMWGRVNTETKSIQTIVFPSEFSGVPMVFIEQSYPTGNNAQGVSIKTKSKSNFSIQRNRRSYYTDSVDEEFYYIDWFAIGI